MSAAVDKWLQRLAAGVLIAGGFITLIAWIYDIKIDVAVLKNEVSEIRAILKVRLAGENAARTQEQ